MYAKMIQTIRDLDFILKGIKYGAIKENSFTEHTEREILKHIMDEDIQFYIFYDKPIKEYIKLHKAKDIEFMYIGFGAINNHREISKIFVYPEFRRKGYGSKIVLWLMLKCLNKNNCVPIAYVKKDNDAMIYLIQKVGMKKLNEIVRCFTYRLKDYIKFAQSLNKFGIEE